MSGQKTFKQKEDAQGFLGILFLLEFIRVHLFESFSNNQFSGASGSFFIPQSADYAPQSVGDAPRGTHRKKSQIKFADKKYCSIFAPLLCAP
ncbi:MAG: hypothetical protein LBI89_01600 [Prevotellaceae bacterium]|jgi:hypothetical protein|nr:hypothetical protein [Prevotellaceae bacterium]